MQVSPTEFPKNRQTINFDELVEEDVLTFCDKTSVGCPSDGDAQIQVAAYISGYMLQKYNFYHKKMENISIKDCCICKQLLSTTINPKFHLHTTLKQFKESVAVNSTLLNICSEDLVNSILNWENIFLYFFLVNLATFIK